MELTSLKPMDEGSESAEPSFAKSTTEETPGEWRTTAGYTSSLERCATCEYFKPEEGMCGKYDGEVEEGGHCRSWEAMESGDESEAGEEEGDDLEPFEELA